jgi:hypothetical protein
MFVGLWAKGYALRMFQASPKVAPATAPLCNSRRLVIIKMLPAQFALFLTHAKIMPQFI